MSQFDLVLLKQIVEGLLLAANEPLSVKRIIEIFEDPEALFPVSDKPRAADVEKVLVELKQDCEGRGFELAEVASGYRFQVRQSLSPWVSRLWDERPVKYSRAILETLALIAYRQPITRGDIEEIRGVAVSTNIIKTLLERQWVRVVGHRDVPGRPALYATTRQFLDYFNLKSLEELPSLAEIRDIDKINAELDFNQEQALVEQLAPAAANDELSDEDDEQDATEPSAVIQQADASEQADDSEPSSDERTAEQASAQTDAFAEQNSDDDPTTADSIVSNASTNDASDSETSKEQAAVSESVSQTRALIEAEMAAMAKQATVSQAEIDAEHAVVATSDATTPTTTTPELTTTADEAQV